MPCNNNSQYTSLLINLLVYSTYTENLVCVILVAFLFSYSLYWISPRPNTADLALIRQSIRIDLLSIWKSLHMIGQNSRARSRAALNELREKKTMAAIQPISKIVNKQTKIMSTFLKRMSDMGAKNGEDIFDVIEDDMDRYGLLTVN